MNPRLLLAGALATAVLVWFNAGELTWPVRLWTTVLLAGLPVLMVAQAEQLRSIEVLPRRDAYVSSIASLWLLAALTFGAAWAGAAVAPGAAQAGAQLGVADPITATGGGSTLAAAVDGLGLRLLPAPTLLLYSVILTAAGISVVVAFHAAGYRDAPLVRQLIPRSRSERVLFAGVSATAGICEELVFRGFLVPALTLATASLPLALLLSSAVFGVVHAYQKPIGALRAALLGALLAAPLVSHASILPAIVAHTLIDIIAGFWLARRLSN